MAGGQLTGSGHFRARVTVIVHLDGKNLPPAGTSSFCVISEHFFDIRYNSGVGAFFDYDEWLRQPSII
jgi:hypothetical protein